MPGQYTGTLTILMVLMYTFTSPTKAWSTPPDKESTPQKPTKVIVKRPFMLRLILGLGGPTTLLGTHLCYLIGPNQQLAVGFSPQHSGTPQISAMYRILGTQGLLFGGVGAGSHLGGFKTWNLMAGIGDHSHAWPATNALFADAELFVGLRFRSGIELRLTLGGTLLLDRDEVTCVENCDYIFEEDRPSGNGMYVAFSVGISF